MKNRLNNQKNAGHDGTRLFFANENLKIRRKAEKYSEIQKQ